MITTNGRTNASSITRRHRRSGTMVAATLVAGGSLVALGGQVAQAAAVFPVTTLADSGPGSLRAALDSANTTSGPDTIRFSLAGPNTIQLSSPLVVTDDVEITGAGPADVTIKAPGNIIDVAGGVNLSLMSLTLDGAGGSGVSALNSGDLSLARVTVTNSAGPGVVFDSPGATLRATASNIDSNGGAGISASGAIGGLSLASTSLSSNGGDGVLVAGITGATSVTDATIDANVGNGLTITGSGPISIRRTAVTGNQVGVAASNLTQGLEFVESTISGNDTNGVNVATSTAGVTLQRSTVADNGTNGLNLSAVALSTEIRRSTISGHANSAVVANASALTVLNSTFTGNATAVASPVIDSTGGQSVSVKHSTITGNGAAGSTSSTIAASGPTVVEHVILTANGGQDATPVGTTGTLSLTYSLIPNAGVPGGAGVGNVSTTDPMVGPLAENGGPTLTMYPLPGSLALDAGQADLTGNAVPVNEQRGAKRVDNGRIDIGAVEVGTGGLVSIGADVSVSEAAGTVTLQVTRSGGTNGRVDVSIDLVDGTAVKPDDYGPGPVPTTLSWANGETGSKSVTIKIVDDGEVEKTETFSAKLSSDSEFGATILDSSATVSILDNDVVAGVGPAFTTLSPSRFVDTRAVGVTLDGQFQAQGIRTAGSEYRVKIAGRGDVPANAKAAVINVTAIFAQQTGFVTVHPCVNPRPNASSVNYSAGVNVPNEIVAPLSASGEICLYTDQQIHMAVDVVGFVPSDSSTVAVTPARYLDTRGVGRTFDGGFQAQGMPGAGKVVKLRVAGRGDVPAGVPAVIANVTAINATSTGYVTVWPCAGNPPNASSLNHVAGVNRANELVASVNADGDICLFTSERINLAVDVVGYLPTVSSLSAVGPARLLDTRDNGETIDGLDRRGGKREAGQQIRLQVTGRGGVPAGATSVVVNVTAAAPEAVGFVTVHPCVTPRPNASSLNHVPGVNGANELIASVDANGGICLYTDQRTHLIVDVVGYQN